MKIALNFDAIPYIALELLHFLDTYETAGPAAFINIILVGTG